MMLQVAYYTIPFARGVGARSRPTSSTAAWIRATAWRNGSLSGNATSD